MKLKELQTPLNHKKLIGKPTLFAVMPTARLKAGGEARVQYNLMTGHYFVTGQKGSVKPYFCTTIRFAILLMQTINHYNKTGKTKKFKENEISLLEFCKS